MPIFEVMTKGLGEVSKVYVATLVTVDSEGDKCNANYICAEAIENQCKNNIRIGIELLSQVQRQRNTQWANVTTIVTMTLERTKCNESYICA